MPNELVFEFARKDCESDGCTSCKRNSINKRKNVGPGMELSNRMLWSTLKALIFTLSMTHRQKGLKLTDNN